MSPSPSPILVVFIPDPSLELSLLHDDSGDSSSSAFLQHAPADYQDTINQHPTRPDDPDHQLVPVQDSEISDSAGQKSRGRSDRDSDTLTSSDPSSPTHTSFLLLDFSPMSSTSSFTSSSRSTRPRPRTPSELSGYDDVFKPREERAGRRLRQKSTSSGDSKQSSESHKSTKSSNQLRHAGSISNSISSSLRGLKQQGSARVPEVPSHLPPSPSPSDLMSPSLDEDPAAENTRRLRQLHKVSRTLGENIPAELILGYRPAAPRREEVPAVPRRTNNPKRRASISLASISPFKPSTPPAVNSRSIPANPSIPLPAYTYPKPPRIEPSTAHQIDLLSPVAFTESESAMPPPTGSYLVPDPVPESKTYVTTAPSLSRSRSLKSLRRKSSDDDIDRTYTRPQTPFMDTTEPIDPKASMVWVNDGGILVRKERRQGWSGEWNQHDMQDVISKLRNLK